MSTIPKTGMTNWPVQAAVLCCLRRHLALGRSPWERDAERLPNCAGGFASAQHRGCSGCAPPTQRRQQRTRTPTDLPPGSDYDNDRRQITKSKSFPPRSRGASVAMSRLQLLLLPTLVVSATLINSANIDGKRICSRLAYVSDHTGVVLYLYIYDCLYAQVTHVRSQLHLQLTFVQPLLVHFLLSVTIC